MNSNVLKSYQMRLQTEYFSVSSATTHLKSNATDFTHYSVFTGLGEYYKHMCKK